MPSHSSLYSVLGHNACHGLAPVVNCLILGIPAEWKFHEGQNPFCLFTLVVPAPCLNPEITVNVWVKGIGLQQGAGRKSFFPTVSFSLKSFPTAPKFIRFMEKICIINSLPLLGWNLGFRCQDVKGRNKIQHGKKYWIENTPPSGYTSSL